MLRPYVLGGGNEGLNVFEGDVGMEITAGPEGVDVGRDLVNGGGDGLGGAAGEEANGVVVSEDEGVGAEGRAGLDKVGAMVEVESVGGEGREVGEAGVGRAADGEDAGRKIGRASCRERVYGLV